MIREPAVELRTPFALDLRGYRLGRRLLFRGEAIGAVELACGRCAEPYTHEFREPVELLLEPAPGSQELGEGGIELDPDEPGVGRYSGEELDFTPVLLETLALEWPMQPRCTDNCRGLCSVCGINRNLTACSCDVEKGSRPLAALGQLLEKPKRSRD
jgi:uncharacterized protein